MADRQILRYPEAGVPAELWQQVVDLERQAWPGTDGGHDPQLRPVAMLLLEEGAVAAALAILSKSIEHAGRIWQASGLSSVVTDTARRGSGVGRTLVSAAREEIRRGGADLAIFTCDTELATFYEASGFSVLPGAVVVGGTPEDPFPSDQFDKSVLASFFTPDALATQSAFAHSRIELHPGERDRLW